MSKRCGAASWHVIGCPVSSGSRRLNKRARRTAPRELAASRHRAPLRVSPAVGLPRPDDFIDPDVSSVVLVNAPGSAGVADKQ